MLTGRLGLELWIDMFILPLGSVWQTTMEILNQPRRVSLGMRSDTLMGIVVDRTTGETS